MAMWLVGCPGPGDEHFGASQGRDAGNQPYSKVSRIAARDAFRTSQLEVHEAFAAAEKVAGRVVEDCELDVVK